MGRNAQFREEDFKKRLIVVKKYSDVSEDLQLEILYALQLAIARLSHPQGTPRTHRRVCTHVHTHTRMHTHAQTKTPPRYATYTHKRVCTHAHTRTHTNKLFSSVLIV